MAAKILTLKTVPPPPEESLWRIKDVCSYLGVSPSWVHREVNAGNLPALKIVGMLRFIPGEIRGYAEKQRK